MAEDFTSTSKIGVINSSELQGNFPYSYLRRMFVMNKTELISAVAQEAEMTKKDAEKAVKAVIDVISKTLVKGEKVQLIGFGTFEIRQRKAREGHNPATKQAIKIPASKSPAWRVSKQLKEKVNAKKAKKGKK